MNNIDTERLRSIKILVVDDDPFSRKVVRRVLDGLHIAHVAETPSGEAAIGVMRDEHFDLVITDVQMPGINGLELLRRLRTGSTGAPSDTRVIVLTSFSNTEVLGIALALDVNGFLVKPMKPASVAEKIMQAVSERVIVRPPLAYQSVRTTLLTVETPHASGAAILDPVRETRVQDTSSSSDGLIASRVALMQLKPGMQLAEPVRTIDGTLLLAHGHVLSQLNINRLIDLRGVLREDWLTVLSS
ncbi:response regulator [Herbaspirillum sp. HC18]|nr:response regulator [Herbaspirillum sp. HC18]